MNIYSQEIAKAIVKNACQMVHRRGWNSLLDSERDSSGSMWLCESESNDHRAIVFSPNIARAFFMKRTIGTKNITPVTVVLDKLALPQSSCGKARIKKRQVDTLSIEADRHNAKYIIFVTDELTTPAAQNDFRSIGSIEYFHSSELIHDPVTSIFGIPTYQLITDKAECSRLFQQWHALPTQFPIMDITDPICRYYGATHGNIFKIIDQGTGDIRYRIVSHKK